MSQRRQISSLRAAAFAAVCALALNGCSADSMLGPSDGRHLAPLSPQLMSLIDQKGMTKESPILLRIYKEESELEVWKQTKSGQYELLKKYPICKWSGELGPKIREGDRQAPEGFYAIRPELMNPHSSYHLAFNLGYPNEFDRSHNRTGAHLMVHGDCSSRGCYAMTDAQISEIFALAREAFDGGQLAFQVQAFPFRMTAANMARHRNNPNLAFWKMLKEGSDHFEATRVEPKIDVCARRYIFNKNAVPNDPMKPFDPTKPCPAYHIQNDISVALQNRQNSDRNDITALVNNNLPAAPTRMNTDGGTHPAFNGQNPQADAADDDDVQPAAQPKKKQTTKKAAAPKQKTKEAKEPQQTRQTQQPVVPGSTPIRPANGGFNSFTQQ